MEALVVLFDTLVKFKCVTVPDHLYHSFDTYCEERGYNFFIKEADPDTVFTIVSIE